MLTRTRRQPVLHAVQESILLWLRCRAQHALQAPSTLTVTRRLNVLCAELARTQQHHPHCAQHVQQAPPTLTQTLPPRALSAMPGTFLRKQQQHAISARQVPLTQTLTQQHRARHAFLAPTPQLARLNVSRADPDKPIWTAIRRLRVWLAEPANTRLSHPHRAQHALQAPPTQTVQPQPHARPAQLAVSHMTPPRHACVTP